MTGGAGEGNVRPALRTTVAEVEDRLDVGIAWRTGIIQDVVKVDKACPGIDCSGDVALFRCIQIRGAHVQLAMADDDHGTASDIGGDGCRGNIEYAVGDAHIV